MNKIKKKESKICPKCGGKVVEIVHGFAIDEHLEASERGEIILGGCCVCILIDEIGNKYYPQYGCVNCNEVFYKKNSSWKQYLINLFVFWKPFKSSKNSKKVIYTIDQLKSK